MWKAIKILCRIPAENPTIYEVSRVRSREDIRKGESVKSKRLIEM